MKTELSVVGKRLPDIHGVAKVTGAATFVSDVDLPGMLIAKVLHSPYAHAKIAKIDTSKAEKLPGVETVITMKDVPRIQYAMDTANLQQLTGIEPWGVRDTRVLDEKVRYYGDAVAAVAAINESVAEEAIGLIDVKYEQLPAVFDPVEAMKEGAPRIHDKVQRKQADGQPGEEVVEKNLGLHVELPPEGDITKGFNEADFVIDETMYNTTQQRHSPLETFACVASFNADGRLTVWTPNQLQHLVKKGISFIFGIPVGKITVKAQYIGGAFGAGWLMVREPLCVALAKKTGKPVKLFYTRQEEFSDRPPREAFSRFNLKMGFKNDGSITAIERKLITRPGSAVAGSGLGSMIACACAGVLYRCPNKRNVADVVYTNEVPRSSMRGYGAIQDCFIREQIMDMAAEKIGMDPLELRLKNLSQVGDPGIFGPNFPIASTAMAQCIKIGAEKIGWKEKRGQKKDGTRKRGVGLSCVAYVSGAWPAHQRQTSAIVKFNEDGTVVLSISPSPIGNNAFSSMAQVAAEVLGISFEDVHIVWGNTDVTLWELGSFASSSAYLIGNAVIKAAEDAKGKLLKRAARKLDLPAEELDIKDRRIYSKTDPQKGMPIAEVTMEAIFNVFDNEQFTGCCMYTASDNPPAYQACFAEVEVDTETGEVDVLKVVVVNDSGTMLNPLTVEGSLQGGVVQALGFGLWEHPVADESGRILTDDFDTYKIASTLDAPDMEVIGIEEAPAPTGPFGAKGAGEIGIHNPAAAVANAIYDAIGIRIWEPPITPEKILQALRTK